MRKLIVAFLILTVACPAFAEDFTFYNFKKKAAAVGGGGGISLTGNLQSVAAGTRTNTTPTEPTGAAENDIFIAALLIGSDTAVTAPDGWSLLYTVNYTVASTNNLYVYGIRRGASSPALTWSHASADTEMVIKRYAGVITSGSFQDCTGSSQREQDQYTFTALSITTATDGAALVMIAASWVGNTVAFGSWTSPLTERYDGTALGLADGLGTTAGASGNKTSTGSDGYEHSTVLLALKPAP